MALAVGGPSVHSASSPVIAVKPRGQSVKRAGVVGSQPQQGSPAEMAQREKSSVAVASLSSSAPTAVPSGERWGAAIGNLGELGANVESLQKLLARKAVFVDDDVFSKASLASEQARSIKILDQRVQSLERELDAAISAAARARTEKRQAEAAQRAAELRAQEVTKELENTARVFQLHMEELRAKQEEIAKRDSDIKVLEAIIRTLSSKDDGGSSE